MYKANLSLEWKELRAITYDPQGKAAGSKTESENDQLLCTQLSCDSFGKVHIIKLF